MKKLHWVLCFLSVTLACQAFADEVGPFVIANNYEYWGPPNIASSRCAGGSSSDSRAAFWPCKDISRYKWYFQKSEISGWYYIVNYHNRRCLSRYSKGNKIRYYDFDVRSSHNPYDCKKSDFRLWRLLDDTDRAISPFDIHSATVVDRIELMHKEDLCLTYREYGFVGGIQYPEIIDNALRTGSCSSPKVYLEGTKFWVVPSDEYWASVNN